MLERPGRGGVPEQPISNIGRKILGYFPKLLSHSGIHPELQSEADASGVSPVEGGLLGRHYSDRGVRKFQYLAHRNGYDLKALLAALPQEDLGQPESSVTRQSFGNGDKLYASESRHGQREKLLTVGPHQYHVVLRGYSDFTSAPKTDAQGKTSSDSTGMAPAGKLDPRAQSMTLSFYEKRLPGATFSNRPLAEVSATTIPVSKLRALNIELLHDPAQRRGVSQFGRVFVRQAAGPQRP